LKYLIALVIDYVINDQIMGNIYSLVNFLKILSVGYTFNATGLFHTYIIYK